MACEMEFLNDSRSNNMFASHSRIVRNASLQTSKTKPLQQTRFFGGHGYPPTVTGIARTTNFGHFSLDWDSYPRWKRELLKFCYRIKLDVFITDKMEYRRMGFCFEDILAETPAVANALERLPDEVISDRDDRIKEALVIGTRGDQLPKEQWRKPHEDRAYLAYYLGEVMQEQRDREAFRPR